MTTEPEATLCPDEQLSELINDMTNDAANASSKLTELIRAFPSDPRLLFLQASDEASSGDYDGAKAKMRRAVDIAPDFAIARFQLGLLHLTSGEAHTAQEVWGPLHALPHDHYLYLFVQGLCNMIADAFPAARDYLERGILANTENMPLNHDMEMILKEIQDLGTAADGTDGTLSSAQMLLQQSALKGTRH